jgi:DNA primase
VPVYINSPGTSLYRKAGILFGLPEARALLAGSAMPVLAEGALDAIAVTTARPGRYAGLAPCGTAFTTAQAAALATAADLPATGALTAFDADRAGNQAAIRTYHLLAPLTTKLAAVSVPAGSDPAQILRDHGPRALAEMLASRRRPLADLVTDSEVDRWSRWLEYPGGQIGALRATAPLIAAMPPPHVARQVTRLAHRLGLGYATVTEAVTDTLTTLITSATPVLRSPRPATQGTPAARRAETPEVSPGS